MAIIISERPFEPWDELRRYQEAHAELLGRFGATAVFVGSMRDFNEDENVHAMTLEHYPGMTDRHLEDICEAAVKRWQLL